MHKAPENSTPVMSEIPNGIMEAAERALDNLLCNCTESCGDPAGVRAASIHDIAATILAERERIAEWLESNGQPGYATEVRNMK